MIRHDTARTRLRGSVRAWLGLALLALVGCGGGEGASLTRPVVAEPPNCKTTVSSGFSGDLNAVFPNAGGDSTGGSGDGGSGDGGSGDGGGGDGSGSAGVGGGEGKVLGGLVSVTRLADGVVLGTAVTDRVDGLATVNWCRSDMPVMVTLSGQAGAKYYDESTDTLLDFLPGVELHTLVDRFDENIGVSALTESAYRYALNSVAINTVSLGLTPGAVATAGVPLRMTGEKVRLANNTILGELNRLFTDPLQQVSIRSLPTPLDSNSSDSVMPRNRYGKLAALTGGLAKIARAYNFDTPTPAIRLAIQLSLDLSDGRLDGLGPEGNPVAKAGDRAFDKQTASQAWSLGMGLMGARFGVRTTLLDGEAYFNEEWVPLDPRADCPLLNGKLGRYLLSKIGTVAAAITTPASGSCLKGDGTDVVRWNNRFLDNVTALSTQSLSDRLFAIRRDGSVVGWGSTVCGRLGNGVSAAGIVETPVPIVGLRNIVSIVDAREATLALDADGFVYSWGENYGGALGQGGGPFDLTCADKRGLAADAPVEMVPSILRPRRIPTLANIKALSGDNTPTALSFDGRVYRWGRYVDEYGNRADESTPQLFSLIAGVTRISSTDDTTFALRRDGTVWGWGANTTGSFGDGTHSVKMPPQQVAGVGGVVDILSDGFGKTMALLPNGRVLVWGGFQVNGSYFTLPLSPGTGFPVFLVTGSGPVATSEVLPRAVRLMRYRGNVAFVGANGNTYYFTDAQNPANRRWNRVDNTIPPEPLGN